MWGKTISPMYRLSSQGLYGPWYLKKTAKLNLLLTTLFSQNVSVSAWKGLWYAWTWTLQVLWFHLRSHWPLAILKCGIWSVKSYSKSWMANTDSRKPVRRPTGVNWSQCFIHSIFPYCSTHPEYMAESSLAAMVAHLLLGFWDGVTDAHKAS